MSENQQQQRKPTRRSTFFSRARASFYRSGGDRGANVDTMRGSTGANFEGTARISRGTPGVGCLCFCRGQEENGLTDRFILIKGNYCFVYENEESSAPRYAIDLQYLRPNIKPHQQATGKTVVLLENSLGDVEYELVFENEELAKEFGKVAGEQASAAQAEAARKKLGHEQLLVKRSSVAYAESVAKKKVDSQPEPPVSNEDIIKSMPVSGY